jgi:uncharacterized protein YutE (UPF0331/DUF86 family)
MKKWPLFAVAGCSIVLIIARIIWPRLQFDSTSLILFGVAALALLVAFLPIKRIKWGVFEAELDRAVDGLERKVAATETQSSLGSAKAEGVHELPPETSQETLHFFDEFIATINSPTSTVEKIIAATILIEKRIAAFANALGPEFGVRGTAPATVIIDQMAKHDLINDQERAAFIDLWAVRNKIVHEGMRPTEEQTARFLDLAWRLVRTLG